MRKGLGTGSEEGSGHAHTFKAGMLTSLIRIVGCLVFLRAFSV